MGKARRRLVQRHALASDPNRPVVGTGAVLGQPACGAAGCGAAGCTYFRLDASDGDDTVAECEVDWGELQRFAECEAEAVIAAFLSCVEGPGAEDVEVSPATGRMSRAMGRSVVKTPPRAETSTA